MNWQLKKIAAATILALGLPASAFAIQGVHFDPDSTSSGAAGISVVKTFDWGPGAVLYSDCFGTTGIGGPLCTIRAQGSLSALLDPNGNNVTVPAGITYTFAMTVKAVSSAPSPLSKAPKVGESVVFSDTSPAGYGDLTSTFTIYRTTTAGNALAGTGFNTGTPILTGVLSVVDYAIVVAGAASVTYDQSGSDDWAKLKTISISGTPTFTVNVTSADSTYFTDTMSIFALQLDDIDQTDNSASPFKQVDPSKAVNSKGFSAADVGADGLVDIYCGSTASCSAEFQGDASSTFLTQVVPEPGMLALLGIGLAGVGTFARRRKAIKSA